MSPEERLAMLKRQYDEAMVRAHGAPKLLEGDVAAPSMRPWSTYAYHARAAFYLKEQIDAARLARDFCIECGACFPPRDGEGHCVDWQSCQKRQRD